ncbi:hypothetical protein DP117_16390 [Brasilonema sp. UFV-L1]|nr:hypothetical protein [Brasilonema sp. UFV-L1]
MWRFPDNRQLAERAARPEVFPEGVPQATAPGVQESGAEQGKLRLRSGVAILYLFLLNTEFRIAVSVAGRLRSAP